MEGFTKGAWRADDSGRGDFSIVALREGYVVELGHIDDQHDATLIAAAPELLDACLRIQAQLSQAGVASVAGSLNPAEDAAAQIDAAIKKALSQ